MFNIIFAVLFSLSSSADSMVGLTNSQLRAAAVPMNGTVTCNAGSGTLAVSGPLTDTQIRATPVPVSGTLTCNAGTGTLAVSLATAPTTPVTGTFWQATQPVSAAALPLPSGASTAAKQPALGTAGSASADVISVQGIASMTALKVDGSGVTQPVSGTFWQATQPVSGTFWQATQQVSGIFWQATQPVSGPLTDTQLRATDVNVNMTNASVSVTGTFWQATQPVSGTFWQATQPVSGTFWQATQPVSIATAPVLVAGSAIIGKVGIDQTTPGTTNGVQINAALPAGTNGIGKLTSNAGVTIGAVEIASSQTLSTVTTVGAVTQLTNSLPAGTNAIGKLAANSGVDIGDVDVTSLPALVAGSAIVGKVGIDQTTPGTTNGVQINAALPAGTNGIGKLTSNAGVTIGAVEIAAAQTLGTITTVSTVTSVTAIANALPAGTNAIGKLAANSGVDIGDVDVTSISAGTNRIGSVRIVDSADADLTTAKGTQTSRAVGVQELHDSGRTELRYWAVAAAAGTTGTETLITLTKSSGTAATSTGTSFVITSGKKFRITNVSVATRGHATATIQTTTFNLRVNTAGACLVNSTPIVLAARSATPATASAWDRFTVPMSEGWEITGDGTLTFCISAAATYTTNAPTWDVVISGYEY